MRILVELSPRRIQVILLNVLPDVSLFRVKLGRTRVVQGTSCRWPLCLVEPIAVVSSRSNIRSHIQLFNQLIGAGEEHFSVQVSTGRRGGGVIAGRAPKAEVQRSALADPL